MKELKKKLEKEWEKELAKQYDKGWEKVLEKQLEKGKQKEMENKLVNELETGKRTDDQKLDKRKLYVKVEKEQSK